MRNSRLVQEVRGVMTRFEPLTPEFVAANTEDGLTYEEVAGILAAHGLDINKVIGAAVRPLDLSTGI